MFNPTRDQVRAFFRGTLEKYRQKAPLEGLEQVAAALLIDHPEYHPLMQSSDAPIAPSEANPFLHLSMHLALEEQYAIDQPPGVRAALDQLSHRHGQHEGRHEAMECLGEMLWRSQRDNAPPDAGAYLESLLTRASKD